jgi:hypothetical protein
MSAPIAATSAKSGGLLAIHFWHGVEAFAFLAVTLGGIAAVEWWQRRDRSRPQSDDSDFANATPISESNRRRRTTLLLITALSCAAAAAVHVVVMPEHFEESTLYGCFFLVTAAAQFGYVALLLWRPSRPLLAVGIVANAAVVVLWLVTRLVAIPLGPAAGTREEFSGLDVLASSFEVLFLVCATMLITRGVATRGGQRVRQLLLQPSAIAFTLAAIVVIGMTTRAWPPS